MKAERRHELQQNALADWLGKTIEKAQPHANTILIGTLLVVGAIVAVIMLSGRAGSRDAGAWDQYYQATIIDDADTRIAELTGVAEAHPNDAPGLWARLMAGEARLARGANSSFKNRKAGREDLEAAHLDFEAVVKGAASLPAGEKELLLQRAHWGLARTFESLVKPDDAIAEYQKLAETYPESALGKAATEKAAHLKSMSDWYEWYASVDPSTIEPSATREGGPGGGFPGIPGGGEGGGFDHGGFPFAPPEDASLPDDPDFNLPGPLSLPGAGDLDLDLGTDEGDTPGVDESTEGDDPGEAAPTSDVEDASSSVDPAVEDTSSEDASAETSADDAPAETDEP